MGPHSPPRNPLPWVLLWQAWAGGCNSPQLEPQDPPLVVPAIILASATNTNPSPNEAPVPSTITTQFHGDGTGNGRITLQLPPTCTTHTNSTLRSQHTQVSNSLHQTTLFPSSDGWQAIHTLCATTITQNIVPLTFPNKQTFGNPLDHAKSNGHICLAFCNVARFPIDVYNNSKVQDLWASRPTSRLISLVVAKATSTGKRCHQLDGCMNGSILSTLSVLSQPITPMMTLACNNMVAPFSWAMERSCPLSPQLAQTLHDWDAGSGLPFLVGQESLHTLLVLTAPETLPLSKPIASGHSSDPTY